MVEKELDTQGRETILNITASNGYPSYWCTTHAYAINTGTIPLKLQDIVLIGVDGGGLLDQPIRETEVWCVDTGLITDALLLGLFISPTPIPPCQENDFDVLVQSPGDFDLHIMILGLYDCFIGYQMDPIPSENDRAECPIAFHVEQGAEQNDTQTF